jgi:uncharacterized glyoxalase superfamily protein PhnB
VAAEDTHESKVAILWAEPHLCVRDVDAACDYYCTKLGFDVAFKYGEPVFFAQVKRQSVRINLRHCDSELMQSQMNISEQGVSVTFALGSKSELEALHLEVLAQGADLSQPPKSQPWGAMNFLVRDLDGNLIQFASPDSNEIP